MRSIFSGTTGGLGLPAGPPHRSPLQLHHRKTPHSLGLVENRFPPFMDRDHPRAPHIFSMDFMEGFW